MLVSFTAAAAGRPAPGPESVMLAAAFWRLREVRHRESVVAGLDARQDLGGRLWRGPGP